MSSTDLAPMYNFKKPNEWIIKYDNVASWKCLHCGNNRCKTFMDFLETGGNSSHFFCDACYKLCKSNFNSHSLKEFNDFIQNLKSGIIS